MSADIKALVRRVRSAGSAVALQGNQLQAKGEVLEADALAEAVQELMAATETLERWRLHQAQALRLAAASVASQRFALEDFERRDGPGDLGEREKRLFGQAAGMTDGVAGDLDAIARQLDPRDQEDASP